MAVVDRLVTSWPCPSSYLGWYLGMAFSRASIASVIRERLLFVGVRGKGRLSVQPWAEPRVKGFPGLGLPSSRRILAPTPIHPTRGTRRRRQPRQGCVGALIHHFMLSTWESTRQPCEVRTEDASASSSAKARIACIDSGPIYDVHDRISVVITVPGWDKGSSRRRCLCWRPGWTI